MGLKEDFQRFQRLHSWYKHIPFEGRDIYAFQTVGQQPRNGLNQETLDLSGTYWHFSGYKPEGVESYKTRVGPFLRGVEGIHDRITWGLWIIRKDNPEQFQQMIETKYPEWINVDWDSIEHKLDDPIVIQLFERETGEYWDALIQAVPDTLRT
jgi:hypothetical protein